MWGRCYHRFMLDELNALGGKLTELAGLVRALGPGAALLGDDELERVRGELSWLQRPASGLPVRTVAHCFCGL